MTSSSTGFSLKQWYSHSNTYLQIYTPEKREPAECNKNMDVVIKLKSNKTLQGNLYYQIQSRSAVLYSGSYNLDTHDNADANVYVPEDLKLPKLVKRDFRGIDLIKFYLCFFLLISLLNLKKPLKFVT